MKKIKYQDHLIVVVTGGRAYPDRRHIFKSLSRLRAKCTYMTVIEGGYEGGADKWAREWCAGQPKQHVDHVRVNADWNSHGRAAGPIRNRYMLEEYAPDLLVAFPGGRGTASCMEIANELDIQVWQPTESTL